MEKGMKETMEGYGIKLEKSTRGNKAYKVYATPTLPFEKVFIGSGRLSVKYANNDKEFLWLDGFQVTKFFNSAEEMLILLYFMYNDTIIGDLESRIPMVLHALVDIEGAGLSELGVWKH